MKPKSKPIKWDSEIAYIVGLITSDGCLSNKCKTIDFTSKDKELVKTFKKCLNLKNKIGYKYRSKEKLKKYWRIQFNNVAFYKWLIEIGLTPCKSKTLNALKIPDKYFFKFLRGILDGDGHIRNFQDPVYPNSQRLYIVFYSASLNHLKWLQQKINSLLNIHGFIEHTTREFRLTFAKKESLKLLPCLYHNDKDKILCLRRKYRVVQSFLTK